MGIMANELSLGCDCLGQIHYLVSCGLVNLKLLLIKNNFSRAALFHMMVVLSFSRMLFAFMKRTMVFFGNTLITDLTVGGTP
jgi:hypothetical protein